MYSRQSSAKSEIEHILVSRLFGKGRAGVLAQYLVVHLSQHQQDVLFHLLHQRTPFAVLGKEIHWRIGPLIP